MKELNSLEDLFDRKLFRIPDYQRGYSWTKEQLTEFWEDVVDLPTKREHYTGMISLKPLTLDDINVWYNEKWLVEKRDYSAFYIVDGQQRITTFIILIHEIVKYYKSLPENIGKKDEDIYINTIPLSEIISKYLYIVKPETGGQFKTFKFGYDKGNDSANYFNKKILETDVNGNIVESFYNRNLSEAKSFFNKNITKLANENKDNIEELYIKLTQNLKFNIYTIQDNFNVFIAFETMNNRGKKLSTLELLKNRLIYLVTLLAPTDEVEIETRNAINNSWKTIYEYLGKNPEKKLEDDDFLKDHWIIYFGYNRSVKAAFSNFILKKYFNQRRVTNNIPIEDNDQDSIENDNKDIEDIYYTLENNTKEKLNLADITKYVNSVSTLISTWYYIHNPEQSPYSTDIKQWLSKLNNIGISYFAPLTTVVLSNDNISDIKKLEYLKAVERYIFIFFKLTGNRSNVNDSYYYGHAKKLYYGKVELDDIIEDLSNIKCLYGNNIIDINVLNNYFSSYFKDSYGFYSWPAIHYFLFEYELELVKKNNTSKKVLKFDDLIKTDKNNPISIEHIYPQNPEDKYWIDRFNMYNDENRNYLKGSLGNLLPLVLHINESLQNYSYIIKKQRYCEGSNSEIELNNLYHDWTPDTILARGKKMLTFMEERWNFKFNNEYDKVILLGLTFLEKKPIDYNDTLPCKETDNLPNKIDKWKYNGKYYNNKEMIRTTIVNYINSNNIFSYEELPEELKKLKMHSHLLFKEFLSQDDIQNGYSYNLVETNYFNLYIRDYGDSDDTVTYAEILLKYCNFDLESISDSNQSKISREMVEKVYFISKEIYEQKLSYDDGIKIMTQYGMNSNSAAMYIDCFDKMMKGEAYKRTTSIFAADYYIVNIRNDYGKEYSEKALQALEKHIAYLGGNKGLEEVLQKQRELNKD